MHKVGTRSLDSGVKINGSLLWKSAGKVHVSNGPVLRGISVFCQKKCRPHHRHWQAL